MGWPDGYAQPHFEPRTAVRLLETPFQTKYGQNSEFDPTVKDPLTGMMGAIVHQSGSLSKPDRNNFEPRVGLAWNFAPKWAFRASFGVIHADILAPTQNIGFRRVRGDGDDRAGGGQSELHFQTLSRAAELRLQFAVQRRNDFRGNELFHAHGNLVGPQHAESIHDELVGRGAVGVRPQLDDGGAVPGAEPASG